MVELIPFNINNKSSNEEKKKFEKNLEDFLELTNKDQNIVEIIFIKFP